MHSVRRLWSELGLTMRALRQSAGLSLRQVEHACGVGRGTLSQIENGKGHPNRELVEWYDTELSGDGLLLSMYAEARGAYGRNRGRSGQRSEPIPGDALEVVDSLLASGQAVPAGGALTAGWSLRNTGAVTWAGRRARRVGAHAAIRLISSPALHPVPDCEPGQVVHVRIPLRVPDIPGTYAAYWSIVDQVGGPAFAEDQLLHVVLVAQS